MLWADLFLLAQRFLIKQLFEHYFTANMATGIKLSAGLQEILPKAFTEGSKIKALYLHIVDTEVDGKKSKEVDIEKTLEKTEGEPSAYENWSSFCETLPNDVNRYLLVDFDWRVDVKTGDVLTTPKTGDEGGEITKSKVLFVLWTPEASPVKTKMLYAGTKQSFQDFDKGWVNHQANDYDELEREDLLAKCALH